MSVDTAVVEMVVVVSSIAAVEASEVVAIAVAVAGIVDMSLVVVAIFFPLKHIQLNRERPRS